MKKKVFVSFDYEHDNDIKGSLLSPSHLEGFPFNIVDLSINEAVDSKWKQVAR